MCTSMCISAFVRSILMARTLFARHVSVAGVLRVQVDPRRGVREERQPAALVSVLSSRRRRRHRPIQ